MLAQDLLVILRAVLAASIGVDLRPKFPPALCGVLGIKSLSLSGYFVHRLSLQKFHWG